MLAHQSVVKVDFSDGNGQIDADGESGGPGEQAKEHEQTTEKLREGGKISGPRGQSEAGDEVSMLLKSTENLVVSVSDHDGAKGETHEKKCEGLQAIEVAQGVPFREKIA